MCDYPQRLLPDKYFKIINQFDETEILCRWTKYPLKDETGRLSALAVDEKRLPGYSTNKIPPSATDDILIAFYNQAIQNEIWNEGDEPISVDHSDFYYDLDRKYFFITISDVNNFEGQYPYPYSTELNQFTFRFKVLVKHAPLKVNYSHCEFEIIFFDQNGKETTQPSKNSLQKVVLATIRDKLIRESRFSV